MDSRDRRFGTLGINHHLTTPEYLRDAGLVRADLLRAVERGIKPFWIATRAGVGSATVSEIITGKRTQVSVGVQASLLNFLHLIEEGGVQVPASARRPAGPYRHRGKTTEYDTCVHGHKLTPANTRIRTNKSGSKTVICKICMSIWQGEWRRKRREARAAARSTSSTPSPKEMRTA